MANLGPSEQLAQPKSEEAPPTPATKKPTLWVWFAVGCGSLFIIVALLVTLGGLWVFKKGKDFVTAAGKNPALAAAKLAAAADPDIEVVASDDEAGTVTIRNRKTGKVLTLNVKDIKEGKLSFRDEKGNEVQIEGKGNSSLKISSEKGELTVGEDGSLPSWVPLPAGVKLKGIVAGVISLQNEKGAEGGGSFTTDQPPGEILRFYEEALKSAGFSPSVSKFEQDGKLTGGLVRGQTADGRELSVGLTTSDGKTEVNLFFREKR